MLNTPQVPVLWQPEPGADWEPFCTCDGSAEAEACLIADFMEDAPPGADARIERLAGTWRIHLTDPPEG